MKLDSQQIYTGLMQRGFDSAHAAMLAGNMQQESGFNSQAWNSKEGAGGLLQWRLDRLQNLLSFAKSTGQQPGDPNTQLNFVAHEMNGSESNAGKAFMSAQDPASMNAALKGYIRYGDNSQGTRFQNGQSILNQYGKTIKVSPAGQGATGSQSFNANDFGDFMSGKTSMPMAQAKPQVNTGAPGQISESPIQGAASFSGKPQGQDQMSGENFDSFMSGKTDSPYKAPVAVPTQVPQTATQPQLASAAGGINQEAQAAPAGSGGPQTINIADKGDLGAEPGQPGSPGHLFDPAPGVSNGTSQSFSQGLSFGAGDEIGSAVMAPVSAGVNYLTGKGPQGISENYQDEMQRHAAQLAYERQNQPIGSALNEIGGGLLWGGIGKAGNAVQATASGVLPKLAAMGMTGAKNSLIGTGVGAVQGFNSGNSLDDRIQKAKEGAETGGVAGLVAGPLIAGGAKVANAVKNLGNLLDPLLGTAGEKRIAQRIVNDQIGNADMTANSASKIPGVNPTAAEVSGDANVATFQRQLMDRNPSFFQRMDSNNQARVDFLTNITRTPAELEAADTALSAQTSQAVGKLFKPGQSVDTAPVVQKIDDILQGTSGKGAAVSSTMNELRSKFIDGEGNLIPMDAKTVYDSLRKQDFNMMLNQKSASPNAAWQHATSQIKQVQGVLDDQLDQAAPGFKNYIKDQADARSELDGYRFLQSKNLVDGNSQMTISKVQSAIKSIVDGQAKNGINPAKNVTQAQFDALKNLESDLKRKGNIDLGRGRGSPTSQNLVWQDAISNALPFGVGKLVGRYDPSTLGAAAGAYIGDFTTGGGIGGGAAGAIIGKTLGGAANKVMGSKNSAVLDEINNLMLNPSLIKRVKNLPVNRLTAPAIIGGVSSANKLLPSQQ